MGELKVLLPVDLQDREAALSEINKAILYLSDHPSHIHFLSIMPSSPLPLFGGELAAEELQSALAALDEELQSLVNEAAPSLSLFTTCVVEGKVFKEILKYAEQIEPDLIILPSHSHSKVENLLIGSVTSKVVEKANCSVLVVR